MHIAIFGATGFLGTNLIQSLLRQTDWDIRAVGRDVHKVQTTLPVSPRVEAVQGDVMDYESTYRDLQGIDVAYYFVHMMGHPKAEGNFYANEMTAAQTFVKAIDDAHTPRVVFMGGLGIDDAHESQHLAGRHHTGEMLRTSTARVIELRASMIIGEGSVAYDIISNIARSMPIMLLPRSAKTLTQPLTLADALRYLTAAASLQTDHNQVIEIGGPKTISYQNLYRRYAKYIHKMPIVMTIPYTPTWLSSLVLDRMTPHIHARIGKAMVDSLACEMIVTNDSAARLFPEIIPEAIETAFTPNR